MNPRRFALPCLLGICAAVLLLTIPAFSREEPLEDLVERSRAAMKSSHWEKALEFNSRAVASYGKDNPLKTFGAQFGAIYYHKGVCEMKLKKWQEAITSFESCYRDFPNSGASSERANPYQKTALLKWGEAAMGAENWELAISQFDKFIAERDKTRDRFSHGAFYINNAVCQYQLGRIAEGNDNLEIAIRNKADFPTPEIGIMAAFQALVVAVIVKNNEQALLDFIDKNRGELLAEPGETDTYPQVFLKLAGDAFAAGMQRAALAIYQITPPTFTVIPGADSPDVIKLAGVALIHEKSGNFRGAFAAYQQLELYYPDSANRENAIYQIVRTASLIGETDIARQAAGSLAKLFPNSPHLAEIRAAGIDIAENASAAPVVKPDAPKPNVKPVVRSREMADAIALYQGRKYQAAKAAFTAIKARHKAAGLAAFYETECLRKLGDLEGLARALKSLVKDPELGEDRLRQLEIDALWEEVRTKNWDKLARDHFPIRLPADQRAQVAYCHALALENNGNPKAAMNAYNIAMTADAGASEEIARQAALHVLRIHLADPEVRATLAKWGTPELQESPGVSRLQEAAAVASLFELSLGAGMPLPPEFRDFLKARTGG